MSRQKTSQAETYSARLNPIHDIERRVLTVIQYWEDQGVNFKQLVVDRIARYDLELTPEMFARETAAGTSSTQLLERFTEHLLDELQRRGVQMGTVTQGDTSEESMTPFAKRFAEGFLARQRKSLGDEE